MRILLAVDESEYSDAATKSILERPWPSGSVVRVLCVAQVYIPLPNAYGMQNYEQEMQTLLKRAQDVVEQAAAKLGGIGTIDTCVREGDPRTEIVEEGKSWGADLIVVGSHGRTGMKRWLLGSVAEHVVRHAPCTVEVVRSVKRVPTIEPR
jgi:nucleotide-binding universal stress UspA family protein